MTRLHLSRSLLPLFILAAGCSLPVAQPSAQAPGEVAPPEQPVLVPVTPRDAQPIPEPGPPVTPLRFELTPTGATVAAGGALELELVNATSETHRYHHPGGSSGCASFRWSVQLIAEDGTVYDTDPPSNGLCTAVMVPPSDHVFKPGQLAAKARLDLASTFHTYRPDESVGPLDEPRFALVPKGRYTVRVTGAGVYGESKLTVL